MELIRDNMSSVVTLVIFAAGCIWGLSKMAARISTKLDSNNAASAQRDLHIESRIEEIFAVGTPRVQGIASRLNRAELDIEILKQQSNQITKLAADMEWIKGTMFKIADKLGVTAESKR